MEKVLSQDEVDALLRGISDGAIKSQSEAKKDGGDLREHDFTSRDRIIRAYIPPLKIINDQQTVDHDRFKCIKRQVLDVEVELRAELGTTTIKGHDLLRLEVGDVLLLDQEVHHPLMVSIEGVPKFKGVPGISKGNRAIQVTEVIGSFRSEKILKRTSNHG